MSDRSYRAALNNVSLRRLARTDAAFLSAPLKSVSPERNSWSCPQGSRCGRTFQPVDRALSSLVILFFVRKSYPCASVADWHRSEFWLALKRLFGFSVRTRPCRVAVTSGRAQAPPEVGHFKKTPSLALIFFSLVNDPRKSVLRRAEICKLLFFSFFYYLLCSSSFYKRSPMMVFQDQYQLA